MMRVLINSKWVTNMPVVEFDIPEPEIVPEGVYRAVCAHTEERESRVTGNQFVSATWVLLDEEYEGRILYQAMSKSPNARWIWGSVVDDPMKLTRRIVYAEVSVDDYQGTKKNKVGKLTLDEPPPTVRIDGYTYKLVGEESAPTTVDLFGHTYKRID